MSDKTDVMALLDAMYVTACNLRVAGKHAKAEFLCATEALLRTYFDYDQESIEAKAELIFHSNSSAAHPLPR